MSKAGELAAKIGGGWFGDTQSKKKPTGHRESPILITMDLGATYVRAMAAKIDEHDKIHVLGATNLPVPPETVEDGIVTHTTRMANLIDDCFIQLAPVINHYRGKHRRQKNEPYSSVFISVGSSTVHDSVQTSIRRFHPGHRITERDIEEMQSELIAHATANTDYPTIYHKELVEHILDETESTQDPLDEVAESLSTRVHFLVGEQQLREKLAETFARIANLALEQTFAKGAALAYAVLPENDYHKGCAILDFGGGTTSLYVYQNSQLVHNETLPYGSQLLTQDISTVGLLPSTAEKLKRARGKAMEELVESDVKIHCRSAQTGEDLYIKQSDLSYIIECRLDELFDKLFKSISEYGDRINGKIYLCGLGAELDGFDQYIAERTGCTVVYASHEEWLAEDSPRERYANPTYTQLIGTTLMASDYLENTEPQQRPVIRASEFQQAALNFFGNEH